MRSAWHRDTGESVRGYVIGKRAARRVTKSSCARACLRTLSVGQIRELRACKLMLTQFAWRVARASATAAVVVVAVVVVAVGHNSLFARALHISCARLSAHRKRAQQCAQCLCISMRPDRRRLMLGERAIIESESGWLLLLLWFIHNESAQIKRLICGLCVQKMLSWKTCSELVVNKCCVQINSLNHFLK